VLKISFRHKQYDTYIGFSSVYNLSVPLPSI